MPHFKTNRLTFEQKVQLLHWAKQNCFNWWVDILDCRKSCHRQRIDMPFEEIMQKFDERAMFSIIHRYLLPMENYLEIGFRTSGDPDYFLWLQLNPDFISEVEAKLSLS